MRTNWEREQEYLHHHGISTFEVPMHILEWFTKHAYKAKEKGELYTKQLAGHIRQEYNLYTQNPPDEVIAYCRTRCLEGPFRHQFDNIQMFTRNAPVACNTLWVNFQRKYEFNPLHIHSGFASFILFIQIPYDLKEEEEYFGTEMNGDIHTSKLCFVNYHPHDGTPSYRPINVDKSFEGKLLLFGAKHIHQVYPFYTSDDYRITVSGNLKFDVN